MGFAMFFLLPECRDFGGDLVSHNVDVAVCCLARTIERRMAGNRNLPTLNSSCTVVVISTGSMVRDE
jgi:hypothetical protein